MMSQLSFRVRHVRPLNRWPNPHSARGLDAAIRVAERHLPTSVRYTIREPISALEIGETATFWHGPARDAGETIVERIA